MTTVPRNGMKLAWSVTMLGVGGLAAGARAIDITVFYDPNPVAAVTCCDGFQCCGNVVAMETLMEAAVSRWENIIEDNHSLTIRWWFADINKPLASIISVDGNGRPTEGTVQFPADAIYFYDPSPFGDDEFDMRPKLYRTTHPAEQAEAFSGSPPGVFEAAYNGAELTSLHRVRPFP